MTYWDEPTPEEVEASWDEAERWRKEHPQPCPAGCGGTAESRYGGPCSQCAAPEDLAARGDQPAPSQDQKDTPEESR